MSRHSHRFVEEYDDLVQEVLNEYSDYFDRLYVIYVEKKGVGAMSPESFKDPLMVSIKKSIPSDDEFYRSFYHESFFFYILCTKKSSA